MITQQLTNKNQNVMLVMTLEDLTELFKSVIQKYANEKDSSKEEDPHLLSVEESTKILNVSKPTLWRWAKDGYIKPTKIGKRVYYPKSEIEKIIKNGVCTHNESSKTVKSNIL